MEGGVTCGMSLQKSPLRWMLGQEIARLRPVLFSSSVPHPCLDQAGLVHRQRLEHLPTLLNLRSSADPGEWTSVNFQKCEWQ